MKFKLLAVLSVTAALYSCDDSTTGIGDFVSNIDKIEAFSDTYNVTSKTYRLDKVYSRTNRAYLGKYTDSDFGQYSADFITQINCPENFELTEHLEEITGASLELYYTDFYGDSLATLTVQVDTLNKIIDDSDTGEYFKDAYSFINNVLKGFYVHTTNGDGSVVYIKDIWLRLNIDYLVERESTGEIDSIAHGYSVLAASKEILMSTRLENSDKLDELVNEKGHTYLKTPAGLCTEIELPVDDIYSTHQNDTLNSVTLSIKKYRFAGNESSVSYPMGIPQNVLMVRKGDMETFFEQNKTYDNKTSFLGTYNSSTNSYTFSKLNRLISNIFSEIRAGDNDTEDRNKVMLIPVTTETDTEGNIIGVSHDMEINAARLFGGEDSEEELKIEIIYTNPTK